MPSPSGGSNYAPPPPDNLPSQPSNAAPDQSASGMPVFTIQTPSGAKLDIQARDAETALAGARQWHAQQQPSGVVDSLRQGTSDVMSGVGKTLETHGLSGAVSDDLSWAANKVAPDSYTPAPIVDRTGGHPSNIPAWLAHAAPMAAGVILAAGLAPEEASAAVPVGLGAAANWLMSAGNEAQQAAAKRTGDPKATPSTADTVRGDLTAAGESAVGALPVTRFLPSAGTLAKTGTAGAVAALKRLGVTAAAQGAASAGADVAQQAGQTVGTPGGLNIDPTQVANSAAGGVVTGAAFGGKNAARETLDAAKYRDITQDLQAPAAAFANRMAAAADGANLNAGVVGGGAALRTGAEVFNKASAAVHGELSDAVADLRSRVRLPTDANNVLNASLDGQSPTPRDYATLSQAVQGDPQADNVLNLVRQAHVANIVADSGTMTGSKFVGGASSLPSLLNTHTAEKAGLAALMAGAAIEGGAGHLIAYSPQAIAALAGVAGAARLADKLTGARSPAGRFVSNFADGTTPVRQTVRAPQVTSGPPVSPTGPKIPQAPTPWGPELPAASPVVNPLDLPKEVSGPASTLMRGAALAAKLRAAQPVPEPEAPTPQVNPLMLPRTVTGPAANIMRGAALAQKMREAQQAQGAAQSPEPQNAVNPLALPKNITAPAATLMRGAGIAQRLREAATAPQTPAKAGGATQALQALPQAQAPASNAAPVTVTKTNSGTVSVNSGTGRQKLPIAPYWNLSAPEAAQRIMQDRMAANIPISDAGAFLAKTIGVLGTLRDKVQAVTQAAPSIPAVEVARFEGIKTQKDAAAYRDYLKREHPAAADALDRVFSNDAIASQWSQKR